MVDLSKLERIVADQMTLFQRKDPGTIRDIDFAKYLKTKQITVVSGIRRSGKSTLLAQFSRHFTDYYYVNFDDERLNDFSVVDFDTLMLVFNKISSAKTIFVDEIQNIGKWELFIRRLYEEGYKIFVTGSNAKLLSSEIATHLSGRYFKIELYPFSFKEVLRLNKIDYNEKSTAVMAKVLRHFDTYLTQGGFPEYLKYDDSEFVKRIYEDVIYRDLLVRFKVKETKNFKQLASYLLTNFTQKVSYHSLKNILGFKSVTSVKNYIEFMQESYLLFELFKYDCSLKKQYVSDKKIYAVDNGLRNTVAFSFSEDRGKLLENAVFMELKRRGAELYYHKGAQETDFIVKEKNRIVSAIQVTCSINGQNEKREFNGLLEAMRTFNLRKGLLLTENEDALKKIEGKHIEIVPAWKWFLALE